MREGHLVKVVPSEEFKWVKVRLSQAEFKMVKVPDPLENQPPPYGHNAYQSPHVQVMRLSAAATRESRRVSGVSKHVRHVLPPPLEGGVLRQALHRASSSCACAPYLWQ